MFSSCTCVLLSSRVTASTMTAMHLVIRFLSFKSIFSNARSPGCTFLHSYINDCLHPAGWNVEFVKQPAESCALVVALRDIAKGEEFFASYGKWYWRGAMAGSCSSGNRANGSCIEKPVRLTYITLRKLIDSLSM